MNPEIFVTGDKVEVITPSFSGAIGRVVAVSPSAFGRMYSVIIIDGKGHITDGTREMFGPSALRKYVPESSDPVINPRSSLEGKTIKPSQVKIGDEIEVTYKALDISRKNSGVVRNISSVWGEVNTISTGLGGELYRDAYKEPVIKLVKAAEDELTFKLRNAPIRTVFLVGEHTHGIKITSDRWKVDNGFERRNVTTHDLRRSMKGKTVVFLKEEDKISG